MLIGIDIGGTKCGVCCGEVSGSFAAIHTKLQFPTPQDGDPYAVLDLFCEKIKQLAPEDCIDAIGISCGGPLDSRSGRILSPPNLPGWDDVAIVTFFRERYGVPVYLQNDANACALAEWKLGAGQGLSSLVFLTCGTGMGAGLILDGRLYHGVSDLAGEVGHIRLDRFGPPGFGKSGSFEGFCSGGDIAQLARSKALEQLQLGKQTAFCKSYADLDSITAKSVADCAHAGDAFAREIYEISAEKLGAALSLLVDLLNPQAIIIGSIFTRSHDLLWDGARRVMERECIPVSYGACEVKSARLGDDIGNYAALIVATGLGQINE